MSTVAVNTGLSPMPSDPGPEIVTVSEAMLDAIADADRYAVQGFPVLIVGETGTGKELLARRIHARSGRPGALVPVNCAELLPEQAANLLFGHRRGSYTGATESTTGFVRRSSRGTLFLDEITSLQLESQPILLRMVETGEITPYGDDRAVLVDLRIVAAAQPSLRQMLATGAARLDLYERLAASAVFLPSLRDRQEDIWPLATAFANQLGSCLLQGTLSRLRDYHWPGNVRELKSVIQRAVAHASGGRIGSEAIARAMRSELAPAGGDEHEERWKAERERFRQLCIEVGWNAERLMVRLDASRSTLYRRLKEYRISLRRGRKSQFVSGIPETN
jgi:two-component system response regulator FlrC